MNISVSADHMKFYDTEVRRKYGVRKITHSKTEPPIHTSYNENRKEE